MSDGTLEKRHRDDSHRDGGEDEKEKNKNEKEKKDKNTSQYIISLGHGSTEEHNRGGEEDSEKSPSVVVVNGDDVDKENTDDHTASSSSESSMAKGLSDFIASVMEDYGSKAESTINSQNQLEFALDRLTGELDQLLDDAPVPFIMQHAARISGVRKRVKSLNLVLKSIQRRVDNMDRILSTGSIQGNPGPNS